MKKIINGSIYSTETARKIGEFEHSNRSSFDYFIETLYQTRAGKYFLHGEGHASSRYARRITYNEFAPGEEIIPFTAEEAKGWAEDGLDPDLYIAEFGEPEEASDEKKVISASIASDVYNALQREKANTHKPMGELIEQACRDAYMR